MAEVKAMSYPEWNAAQGHETDKLAGMPGMTPEKLEAYKKQLYERYLVTQGAMHSDDSYQYGGQKGGADAAAQKYGGYADRSLEQQDKFYGQQEQQYANAMDDRGRALDARGAQNRVADLMWDRAIGRTPSIAQQQADRQMGQLAAEQTSQAASARGPAALALAQQNQANATATGQSAISGQAQINAAMERERAEQAAFGAYSGMRGQDYQGQQLSQQGQGIALQGAGQAGQQALGYSGLQHSVNTAQLQAQGNKEAQRSADKWAQAGQDQANRARQDAKEAGAISAVATGGIGLVGVAAKESRSNDGDSDGVTSDERAKVPVGRSPGIAPQEPYANPSTYEQSRQAAARALDAEEQREAKARAYGTPQSVGPATHGGIAALDRYEQDQVDTLRAKERHGVPLDAKEKRMAEAMKRGQKYGDKRGPADQPTAPTQPVGTEPVKHTDHKKEEPKQESPSLLSQGLGVAKDVSKDLFARPAPPPNYNFYTPAQQQQITSDMGAKRRLGLNDFMSDMGTKQPYSDERAKQNVSFGFGGDGGAKSSVSPGRREAMEEEADPNAKWSALMKNAPGIPTKEGPDAGHMFSDMGTKQAPMWSDDQTKLAKAWEQGRKAGLIDAGQRPGVTDFEREQRNSQPKREADNRRRAVTDAQLATKRAASPHLISKPGPERDQPPAMSRAEQLTSNVAGKGASFTYNALDSGELTSQEPHEMRQRSGLAAKFRASTEAARSPSRSADEPRSVPMGGGGASGGEFQPEEAEFTSDERAKNRMSDADAAKLSAQADKEIMAMRGAAKSMEASPYAYKEEFRPPEQAPGEVNVGPMAQKMAKDPVARTAVRQDPQTGLLSLDRDKMLKVLAGTSAAQQKQLDEANRQISVLKRDGDRPAAVDMKAERLKRDADAEIGRLRADSERGPSVIDRDRPAPPPSWLSKYMEDEEEKNATRRGGRLALNDLIAGRRRKA